MWLYGRPKLRTFNVFQHDWKSIDGTFELLVRSTKGITSDPPVDSSEIKAPPENIGKPHTASDLQDKEQKFQEFFKLGDGISLAGHNDESLVANTIERLGGDIVSWPYKYLLERDRNTFALYFIDRVDKDPNRRMDGIFARQNDPVLHFTVPTSFASWKRTRQVGGENQWSVILPVKVSVYESSLPNDRDRCEVDPNIQAVFSVAIRNDRATVAGIRTEPIPVRPRWSFTAKACTSVTWGSDLDISWRMPQSNP